VGFRPAADPEVLLAQSHKAGRGVQA